MDAHSEQNVIASAYDPTDMAYDFEPDPAELFEAAKPQPKNIMQVAFDASIRPKLDAIDKVRHHLTGVDIELPAIVVVGDQSSGKSSVLESLSGIGLPRGGNLVTRCPLELALRRGPVESAVLSYTDSKSSQYLSTTIKLEDVPVAVATATERLAGDRCRSGIVPDLISLKVTKPDAPDLTLIDLPGIVRNPIGDQPKDIEQQIRGLINKHIEGDSKVILCVLPATADFATQEAIKISRVVDPTGKRTVGVVTKVDLAEPGIRDRLEATGADHLRLELGYVAVRSRTGQELKAGITSLQARDKEAELFENHPELKNVAAEYKGVPALSAKLVQIQAERIQSHLPALQKQVSNKLRAAEEQMHKMQGVISTEAEAENCLSGLLEQMHRRVYSLVHATPEVAAGDHKTKELHIAPRVNEMLKEYIVELYESIGGRHVFKTADCHEMLREHCKEARGVTLPNMMGDRVFNGIFAEQVYSNLEPSAKNLVEKVHEYMENVLWTLTGSVSAAFPRLQNAIKALTQQKLDNLAQQADANAMANIKGEEHVFTNNPGYMDLLNKMKSYIMRKQEQSALAQSDAPSDEDDELPVVKSVGLTTSKVRLTQNDKPVTCKVWSYGMAMKGAEHILTYHPGYMYLLNTMKSYIVHKQERPGLAQSDALSDEDDEDLAMLSVVDIANHNGDSDIGNSNDEQALVDLQLSLAAYTEVVVKSLSDTIPKLVYAQLVTQIANSLTTVIRDGLSSDKDVRLIDYMHDPQRVAVYKQLQETVKSLKKANAILRKV